MPKIEEDQQRQRGIDELLASHPSEKGASISQYVRESVRAVLKKYESFLPESKSFFSVFTHEVLPESAFSIENETVFLNFGEGKRKAANRIVKAIFYADRSQKLGQPHFLLPLYPPLPDRAPEKDHLCFPWFGGRLNMLMQAGSLALDYPLVKIVALSYASHAAKVVASEQTTALLKKAKMLIGIEKEKQETARENLKRAISKIRFAERYFLLAEQTIKEEASEAKIDEEQLKLIKDIAFLSGDGLGKKWKKHFPDLIRPLMKYAIEDNWEEAFRYRNFLLQHLGACFPKWQTRSGICQFQTIDELASAIVRGDFVLPPENIPNGIPGVFSRMLSICIGEKTWQSDEKILKKSLSLTSEIILNVAHCTANKPDSQIPHRSDPTSKALRYIPKSVAVIRDQVSFEVRATTSRTLRGECYTETRVNFGEWLAALIDKAAQGKSALQTEDVGSIIENAFKEFGNKNSSLDFSLGRYLETVLKTELRNPDHSYHLDDFMRTYATLA